MPILKELVGRLEDTVIGPDGREMVRFHGIFVGLPSIREGQVIQESHSKFRLRLSVDPDFSEQDRKVIGKRFKERLGNIDLRIEIVDFIERSEGGKFKAVISNLQRSHKTDLPIL
jgi:phenylacetate-CoA ligase